VHVVRGYLLGVENAPIPCASSRSRGAGTCHRWQRERAARPGAHQPPACKCLCSCPFSARAYRGANSKGVGLPAIWWDGPSRQRTRLRLRARFHTNTVEYIRALSIRAAGKPGQASRQKWSTPLLAAPAGGGRRPPALVTFHLELTCLLISTLQNLGIQEVYR
jgi:hypothetical protein